MSFLRCKVVVNGRNALPHRAYAAAGVRYRGSGRRHFPATLVEFLPAR